MDSLGSKFAWLEKPKLLCLLISLVLVGCEKEAAKPKAETPTKSLSELLVVSDARLLEPLKAPLRSTELRNRRRAAQALAQFGDPTTLPLLKRALRDPDAQVSSWASLGYSMMPEAHHSEAEAALIGAWVHSVSHETRQHLSDLGFVGGESSLPVYQSAFSKRPHESCEGLRSLLLRVDIPDAIIKLLGTQMDDLMCVQAAAAAMRRASKDNTNPPSKALVALLKEALNSPQPSIRTTAIQSLVRHLESSKSLNLPELLAHENSHQTRIALVGSIQDPERMGWAIHTLSAQTKPDWILLQTLFKRAHRWASEEAVFSSAAVAQQRFKKQLGDKLTPPQAWAYCELSELMDRGRSWPARVLHCPSTPEGLRKVRAANIVGALSGAVGQRLAFLNRLWGAAPSSDVAVAEAYNKLVPELSTKADKTEAQKLQTKILKAHRPALTALLAGLPDEVQLSEANLTSAFQTLDQADDLEGLVAWLKVAKARKLGLGEVAILTHHWNIELRQQAKEAAKILGVSVGRQQPRPQPNPLKPESLSKLATQATIKTTQGEILMALKTAEAPTTVHHFQRLVEKGFYTDVMFHRVIPGFVVQTGDPTATGYGGPGFSQRCENNRLDYKRGMVGMALAGRDTGGSQFFINTTPQPHLNRHYPIFGEVLKGMDVVEQLTPLDRILSVTVSRETSK